jgi:hypothetical protein
MQTARQRAVVDLIIQKQHLNEEGFKNYNYSCFNE